MYVQGTTKKYDETCLQILINLMSFLPARLFSIDKSPHMHALSLVEKIGEGSQGSSSVVYTKTNSFCCAASKVTCNVSFWCLCGVLAILVGRVWVVFGQGLNDVRMAFQQYLDDVLMLYIIYNAVRLSVVCFGGWEVIFCVLTCGVRIRIVKKAACMVHERTRQSRPYQKSLHDVEYMYA